jgi:predicted CXXCH cytochrome family protein
MSLSVMGTVRSAMNSHAAAFRSNAIIFALLLVVAALAMMLTVPDEASAGARIKQNLQKVCARCHKDIKMLQAAPYKHPLFKAGRCTKCHNSHVSRVTGLLVDDTNKICLQCHTKLSKAIREEKPHRAVTDGKCTDCHNPHGSRFEALAESDDAILCLKCHEEVTDSLNMPYTCKAFSQKKCLACHQSHTSTEAPLLKDRPVVLCSKCHEPRCKIDGIPINPLVREKDCTQCHSGHGSSVEGVLGPFGHRDFLEKRCDTCHESFSQGVPASLKRNDEGLCLECHADQKAIIRPDDPHTGGTANSCVKCHSYHASRADNLTETGAEDCLRCHEDTEQRTLTMERAIGIAECAPVRERGCFSCHIPAHSDRPFYFSADPVILCAKCHKEEHSTSHPEGENVIDPRNNRPVTCISCHSMHSARADFMLTHDRNRALCVQCHRAM